MLIYSSADTETVQTTAVSRTRVLSPVSNPNALAKGMLAEELCCNKILQLLIGDVR